MSSSIENNEEKRRRSVLIDPEDDVRPKDKEANRIIYFSDGTMEEYNEEDDMPPISHTEDDTENLAEKKNTPSPSAWRRFSIKTMDAVDYIGGNLAGLFGITDPKFNVHTAEDDDEDKDVAPPGIHEPPVEKLVVDESSSSSGHGSSTLVPFSSSSNSSSSSSSKQQQQQQQQRESLEMKEKRQLEAARDNSAFQMDDHDEDDQQMDKSDP